MDHLDRSQIGSSQHMQVMMKTFLILLPMCRHAMHICSYALPAQHQQRHQAKCPCATPMPDQLATVSIASAGYGLFQAVL